MQFIIEADFAYSKTTKTYNWTDKKWDTLTSKKQTTTFSATTMGGFSPFQNIELCLIAPLVSKSQDTLNSLGMGDFWFNLRYGALAGKKMPVKLTLSGALVVPAADKNAKLELDDRTLDIGLGAILQTKQLGKVLGHLRLGYWLNGKKNDTTKVGDMFEYVAKLDYNVTKEIMSFIQIAGTMEGKTKIKDKAQPETEKDRHNFTIGAVLKPVKILSVRPKILVSLPFISKGGSAAPFSLGLDFWVIAP